MSKLRVLVVHNDAAELNRILNLLEQGSHAVLPLENITEASEALELQRFDAVVLPENTPADELAAFASNLRQLERDRRAERRTSILTYSTAVTETKIRMNGRDHGPIDALLPEHFEPSTFAKTVEQLSLHVSQNGTASPESETEGLPIFEVEGFRELLGHSPELLDEIIGLFLEESGSQIQEMQDCLRTDNLNSLARIAHTLKGSLGTLHAQRARAAAQALEIAATRQTQRDCENNMRRLETCLDELRPLLIQARAQL